MSTEFATLALLFYSFALVGVFAFPTVRQRVPRLAVVLLVVVPWATALFAGTLVPTAASVSMRDSYLELENVFPQSFREFVEQNATMFGISTRNDPQYAREWSVLYDKFDARPCEVPEHGATGEVWIAPGDVCFLASQYGSPVGKKVAGTGICDDEVFRNDYSRESHFLVCLDMIEYDFLRSSNHCYEPPDATGLSMRVTDEYFRSVCFSQTPQNYDNNADRSDIQEYILQNTPVCDRETPSFKLHDLCKCQSFSGEGTSDFKCNGIRPACSDDRGFSKGFMKQNIVFACGSFGNTYFLDGVALFI